MNHSTIVIVDDNIENLQVAEDAAKFFTKSGIDVYLTDDAERALAMIRSNQKVVGVVTDLLFPRSAPFSNYANYVRELKERAERVLRSSEETLGAPYLSRLKEQFELLQSRSDQLPYGGGLALECAKLHIAFVIVSDVHRHRLDSQPLDGATLLSPFCDMGFLKASDLTENSTSRHVIWGASKMDAETWKCAFQQLTEQWRDSSTWKQYLGTATEIRQPDILPSSKMKPAKVKGKITRVRTQLQEFDAECLEKAREIVRQFSDNPSKIQTRKQIEFVQRALIDMEIMSGRISSIRAKAVIWVPGEENVSLPPHSWNKTVFRPDLGVIAAVSRDVIDRGRSSRCSGDNQIRNEVYIWILGKHQPESVYSKTWWDFADDLEDPDIHELTREKVVIRQFEWQGDDSVRNKYLIPLET